MYTDGQIGLVLPACLPEEQSHTMTWTLTSIIYWAEEHNGARVKRSIFRKVAVDRLSTPEELDQLATLTTPRGWLALLGCAVLACTALLWGTLATIPITVQGRGMIISPAANIPQREAILYLSPEDAARVRPGMDTWLALAAVNEQEYGHLLGTISSVGELPASRAEILQTFRDEALAEALGAEGALIEVRITLTADPASASGYRWSLPRGRERLVGAGTPFTATIVTARERPISLLVP